MSKFNISNVDVKLLSIFCAVYEEGSISRAAERLNLSQPLVSHALDRLRLAFKDPLFVRAGRSIAPTDRARFLAPEISELVQRLIGLSEPETLNLNEIETRFCLSANDFERQLLASKVSTELFQRAPHASLRLMDTKDTFVESLRAREYDVVVTPLALPDYMDIHSSALFEDNVQCFFDSSMLHADEVLSCYGELDHAEVDFGRTKSRVIDPALLQHGIVRKIKLAAPSFEALPPLLQGTRMVATLPSRLKYGLFADFECVPLPFPTATFTFNMVWHKATHLSAAHQWFRSLVRAAVQNKEN